MAIPPARASTVPQPPPARAGECCDRWERGLGRETPWGLPQCIQLSSTFSFMWSWTPGGTGLDLSIIGWRRQAPALKELPGHTRQARFALHPEDECGVSGGRRCRRTQEGQGSALFPLGKAESPPCPQQCWRQQLYLWLLSPSLLLLPKN